MIRSLPDGTFRLYSLKVDPRTGRRRNLGTFRTRADAERHERQIEFFKHRKPPAAGGPVSPARPRTRTTTR